MPENDWPWIKAMVLEWIGVLLICVGIIVVGFTAFNLWRFVLIDLRVDALLIGGIVCLILGRKFMT